MSGLTHPSGSVHKELPSPAEPVGVHPPGTRPENELCAEPQPTRVHNTGSIRSCCWVQSEPHLQPVESELRLKICQFYFDFILTVSERRHIYHDMNSSWSIGTNWSAPGSSTWTTWTLLQVTLCRLVYYGNVKITAVWWTGFLPTCLSSQVFDPHLFKTVLMCLCVFWSAGKLKNVGFLNEVRDNRKCLRRSLTLKAGNCPSLIRWSSLINSMAFSQNIPTPFNTNRTTPKL